MMMKLKKTTNGKKRLAVASSLFLYRYGRSVGDDGHNEAVADYIVVVVAVAVANGIAFD